MRPHPLNVFAVAALMLFAVPASTMRTAAQTRDQAFSDGMKSFKDRKWDAAVTQMREAIKADARESTRRVGSTLGLGGDPYLPHFILGRALLALEQCPPALDAWEESERQGVVRQDRDRAKALDDAYAACEQRGFLSAVRLRAEVGPAEQALGRARDAYQEAVGFARANSYALPPQFAAHSAALREAETRLKGVEATHSRQVLQDVTTIANRVAAESRELLTTAKRVVSERDLVGDASTAITSAERSSRDLDAAVAAARPRPILSEPLTVTRAQAVQDLLEAKKALAGGDIPRARDLANGAKAGFDKVGLELTRLTEASRARTLSAADTGARQLAAAIQSKVDVLRAALAAQALPDGVSRQGLDELEQVQRQSRAGLQKMAAAVRAGDLAGAGVATSELSTVRSRLGEIEASLVRNGLRLAGLVVPDTLRTGAAHFFNAQYKDVIGVLTAEAIVAMAPPLRVHGYLFRAAALFALFEYSGRTDAALLASARQAVEACREIDSVFQPDPAAFSPRFLAFFSQPAPAQ